MRPPEICRPLRHHRNLLRFRALPLAAPGRQPIFRARPPVLHPLRQVRAGLRRDRGDECHRLRGARLREPHRHPLRWVDGGLLLRLLRLLRPGLPHRRAGAQGPPRPGTRGRLRLRAHHLQLLRRGLQPGVPAQGRADRLRPGLSRGARQRRVPLRQGALRLGFCLQPRTADPAHGAEGPGPRVGPDRPSRGSCPRPARSRRAASITSCPSPGSSPSTWWPSGWRR